MICEKFGQNESRSYTRLGEQKRRGIKQVFLAVRSMGGKLEKSKTILKSVQMKNRFKKFLHRKS